MPRDVGYSNIAGLEELSDRNRAIRNAFEIQRRRSRGGGKKDRKRRLGFLARLARMLLPQGQKRSASLQ